MSISKSKLLDATLSHSVRWLRNHFFDGTIANTEDFSVCKLLQRSAERTDKPANNEFIEGIIKGLDEYKLKKLDNYLTFKPEFRRKLLLLTACNDKSKIMCFVRDNTQFAVEQSIDFASEISSLIESLEHYRSADVEMLLIISGSCDEVNDSEFKAKLTYLCGLTGTKNISIISTTENDVIRRLEKEIGIWYYVPYCFLSE
jgi:hypothetical protein